MSEQTEKRISRDVTNVARLSALKGYRVLDTAPEDRFDDIVALAALICATPVALVSLVDENRQWFKARLGFEQCETDLNSSVCAFALAEPDLLVIDDLTLDARTRGNPLVAHAPHIRFYAGAPLKAQTGEVIGSLCVIDTVVRPGGLSDSQADGMRRLSRQVMALMEARKAGLSQQDDNARYRQIVNSATDFAIVATDVDGRITDWNTGAQHILLWTAAEMIGKPADRFFTPEDRATGRVQYEMSTALNRGRASDERWHVRKDGTRFWASGEMMPLLDDDGTHRGFIKVLRDRTPEHEAGQKLQKTEQRLRRAQEAGGVGVFNIELDSNTLQGSPEFFRIFGLPDEGSTDAAVIETLVILDDKDRVSDEVSRRAGVARPDAEYRIHNARTGEIRTIAWRAEYEKDDDGRLIRLNGVVQDVTEQRKTQQALQLALSAGKGIGFWDWDVANDRITADVRFATLYGVDPAKAADGVPIADFFVKVHPDDLPRVQSQTAAVLASGGDFAAEYRLVQDDGSVRWVLAQGRCLLNEEHRAVRFPGVSFDITERKTAEIVVRAAKEEREFVIALTTKQRLLNDPDAVIRHSAEALGRRLGVHRVGFYRVSGSKMVRHSANWTDGSLSPLQGEQAADAFGCFAEATRSGGKTLVFSDSRYDKAGRVQAYADAGVLAGLCVPLLDQEGAWQAGIYLHHAEVRRWTDTEIALAKEVAELTWLAVERAEALMRLNQRLERQDTALAQGALALQAEAAGRNAAEDQVRQLQKMEAVGQLTGGIAHDFNNMLAVIIGGLNLMERRLRRGDTDVGRFIEGAMEGATRAAALTQRLLAFSRQQPLSPQPVDGNRLIGDLTDLLTRTLGEDVRLETVLSAGLWKANADVNQLENAIINLAVNARDAMPNGGKLTIEIANVHVDEQVATEFDVPVGQYIQISVSDTGTGMTTDVIAKAFDPFFTTKGVGKGTGLGLSQVFGFMRQSGGHVKVYSEVGHGTSVKLYLPRFYGNAQAVRKSKPVPVESGSPTEIILVVEDEARVRNFSTEALRDLGYTVIHAADGPEALQLIEGGQDVTLLFTDIVMPEMTGRQLADRAVVLLPRMKVVFTTGYTRNAVVHNGILDPGTNFLAKPFGIDQLATKIRSVLNAGTV